MNELSADNVIDYLRATGRIGPGPARAELLGGGVSNVVLSVTTAERVFVLKQSRPQLRTKAAWFSDPERIYREQQVMEALQPLLPAGTVPAVLFVDRQNYLFAMEHAPAGAQVWKERLLAGDIDLSLGYRLGYVLRRIHGATGHNSQRFAQFADGTVFGQLRIDPFYRTVAERHADLAANITPLIDGMLTRREALCHGDYSPKNILVHSGGFTLVDYETAYLGDPAMDLGFFLSHLFLKAIKRPTDRWTIYDLTGRFWHGYLSEASCRPPGELIGSCVGHLGVCLLARVDGTSPVDYLTENRQRDTARRLGRRLLLEQHAIWCKVVSSAEQEIATLVDAREP